MADTLNSNHNEPVISTDSQEVPAQRTAPAEAAAVAETTEIAVGAAQRPGTDSTAPEDSELESLCADGYGIQRRGLEVSATVTDGAGHAEDTVRYATTVPTTITQMGMVMGGITALVTAGRMAEAFDKPPHVSCVYANTKPGRGWAIHWIGDCRAYGWDGEKLTLWSTDQTMGQWLRWNGGVPIEIAETQDNWARLGLRQATDLTTRQLEIPEDVPLVLLCSDGISDQVDEEVAEELCRRHGDDPQALADALVEAAEDGEEDGRPYRDDATAVVLLRRTG
ncbi:PP2C family protein-serine/threonine phosphatase [Streptomyces jumonjinensis]|uniref:PP2C family protein-serine/threonine phosphatase n=1 Tax=Streptomyces jumonjinensis TaxID=1945 RepID=UPI0037BD999D